jgi:leader peptidase (prepilin peptidase)/N-methyltransferase
LYSDTRVTAVQVWLLIISPCIGSFIGAAAHAWPDAQAVLRRRSSCAGCGKILAFVDIVPIVSYIALRARCRCRRIVLSPIFLVAEAGAVLIAVCALWAIDARDQAAGALLGWSALYVALVDVRTMMIPVFTTLALGLAGLGWAFLQGAEEALIYAASGACSWLALTAIAAIFRRVRGRDGLGEGDALLLGALACWLGPTATPVALAAAALITLAAAFALRRPVHAPIPFGPALAGAGALLWIARAAGAIDV